MMLETSKILAMTAAEKADLFANGARQMMEGRYVAAIALASLERSMGYLKLGFKTVKDLAKERGELDDRDATDLLWVGRKLLEVRLLNEAFRDGLLSWSQVKTLVPHIQVENGAELIAKSIGKTSNEVERIVGNQRPPSASGPTRAVYLSLANYRRLQELARGIRAEAGKKYLADEECLMRLFDELEAARETRASGASATTTAPTTTAPTPAATAALPAPSAAADVVVPAEPCAPSSRHIPAAIRRKLMNRARSACEICRNRHGLEVHHRKVPFSKGGPHSLDNLIVLCHLCHLKLHREERQRAAPPPVAACERRARDQAPVRDKADRDGGERPSAENPPGPPSDDGKDRARPDGDGVPLRESA